MTDRSDEALDETAYQIPDSAVGILQRERTDVYIVPSDAESHDSRLVIATPFEDGILLSGSSTDLPAGDETLNVEYGAYRTFPLSEISSFRDDHERIRDQIRHGQTGRPEQQPDADAVQKLIDILVIVERAIKYIETVESSEQGHHYRRVSALCDDPQEVIENVEQAIESGEKRSQPAKTFVSSVWPFADREETEEP